MKLYIAGPITNTGPDHNFPAFNKAAALLEANGYTVYNPAEFGIVDGWSWAKYMRRCLPLLLGCDHVATLEGWTTSRGAKLEVHVARELGMDARPVESWLELRAHRMRSEADASSPIASADGSEELAT